MGKCFEIDSYVDCDVAAITCAVVSITRPEISGNVGHAEFRTCLEMYVGSPIQIHASLLETLSRVIRHSSMVHFSVNSILETQ